MRSTLTLEDEVDKQVRELAEQEHISYKDAVNLCLGKGLERLMAAEKLNQLLDDPELGS